MRIKKFFVSIIKLLIVLVIATLIFSSITLDIQNLLKDVFGDIFQYASPDAQKQVVSKLTETCSLLGQGKDINKMHEKNSLLPDLSKIDALCEDYKAGKINDKELFSNIIGGSFSPQQITPKIKALERYNQAICYLNSNKFLYFVILVVLTIMLYLLIMDFRLFLITLCRISFGIGVLIMAPYLAILAYRHFAGIDTTPIIAGIFGSGNMLNPKDIISIILLLFLRIYTRFIIMLGVVFLVVGVAGKVYVLKIKLKQTDKEKVLPRKFKK